MTNTPNYGALEIIKKQENWGPLYAEKVNL
jgi:hypothetical protein